MYLLFLFYMWRLSSRVPIVPQFGGTETLLCISAGSRKINLFSSGGFFRHLLLLIPGQRVVVEWLEGSARGGLLKGDLSSADWHGSTSVSATKKSLWLLPSNFWSPVTALFLASVASCRAASQSADST